MKKAGQVSSYLSSGAGIFVSSKFAVEGLSEYISYELELFGIKVILEHVFIKTNFGQAMIIAKKLTPYSRMIQKVAANLSSKADNGASAELVAKVILEAVTSKEPNLHYLAGKDVEILAANKRTMSDTEFRNMIGKMA